MRLLNPTTGYGFALIIEMSSYEAYQFLNQHECRFLVTRTQSITLVATCTQFAALFYSLLLFVTCMLSCISQKLTAFSAWYSPAPSSQQTAVEYLHLSPCDSACIAEKLKKQAKNTFSLVLGNAFSFRVFRLFCQAASTSALTSNPTPKAKLTHPANGRLKLPRRAIVLSIIYFFYSTWAKRFPSSAWSECVST